MYVYVTANRCADGLKKKLNLRSVSVHHRHSVWFFNAPVQAQTRGHPFHGYSGKTPHLFAFYDTLGTQVKPDEVLTCRYYIRCDDLTLTVVDCAIQGSWVRIPLSTKNTFSFCKYRIALLAAGVRPCEWNQPWDISCKYPVLDKGSIEKSRCVCETLCSRRQQSPKSFFQLQGLSRGHEVIDLGVINGVCMPYMESLFLKVQKL